MKWRNKTVIVLFILCLAAMVGGRWIFIHRKEAHTAFENKNGYVADQNTGLTTKSYGDKSVVLQRESDLHNAQVKNSREGKKLTPLPTDKPLPYHIKHAVTYGAKAKITLRIVDSKGVPVTDALVGGGFYNHDDKGPLFEERTNMKGEVTLEGSCVGDLNFGVIKNGYYNTETTYWFFKSYFDCVKSGRWIPWNPTIEVVLKEKRKPIALYTRCFEKVFPKNEPVGFDCVLADFIAPFGKGQNADFILLYESEVPSRHATLREWGYQTNSLAIVAPTGGFITKEKDLFSCLVSDYEAPLKGYENTIYYEYKRAGAKIVSNKKLNTDEYLFFHTRATYDVNGEIRDAYYGKIYAFAYAESLGIENTATLRISYYLNPTPGDTNLEFDGETNLFNPDWRDYKWPKEP